MFKIATLNKISPAGLSLLSKERYELTDFMAEANGLILRSKDIRDMQFSDNLLCIARAGVGVNNIDTSRCADEGIVVFNTPAGNANAVKELVIGAMLLASRNLVAASNWAGSLTDNIAEEVEKGKSQFKGCELAGKTLGVIGLGGIGVPVANAAIDLGMKVIGYDAYLSVSSALHLSGHVKVVQDLDEMLPHIDILTVHVHATEETKGLINAHVLDRMKKGSVLLNYSRGSIIDQDAVRDALETGKLKNYVTDFPDNDVKGFPNTIFTPHIGASTIEAEDNCASMAVEEMMDYLENGNIRNSVNFPNVDMGVCRTPARIALLHRNIPNMISKITMAVTELNISDMINRSSGEYAYTLLDVDSTLNAESLEALNGIDGMIQVRVIKN